MIHAAKASRIWICLEYPAKANGIIIGCKCWIATILQGAIKIQEKLV